MKLLIISDAPILTHSGKKEAYAPYVREMDLWMQHARDVTFVCPTRYNRKLLTQPFQQQNFKVSSLRRLEFHNILTALISLITIPYQALVLWNAMRQADHIHLRCPGNLALLASIVQITLPRKRKTTKYAGNFDPQASQPLAYRWQKKILSNTSLTKNIDVLVYGEWSDQSVNIKSFFTATYSEQDRAVFKKEFKEPYQFIFVSTLSQNKNPQLLVELVKQLNQVGIPSQAHFYGDGPMMDALQVMSSEFRVQSKKNANDLLFEKEPGSSNVSSSAACLLAKAGREQFEDQNIFKFYGNQPKKVIQAAYKNAHFSFLASQSEGWPKAVVESMWYGCIPIATPVSCVPWMLGAVENPKFQIPNPDVSEKPEVFNERLPEQSDHSTSTSSSAPRSEALEDRLSTTSSSSISIGSRGVIFKDIEQTIAVIKDLLNQEKELHILSQNAQKWSQEYTLEKFESEIVKLLQS